MGLSDIGMGHYKLICKRAGEGEVMLGCEGTKAKHITHRHMSVCFAFVWDRKQASREETGHYKGHPIQLDGWGNRWCSEGAQSRS